jgi:hypothetical protein
MASRPLRRRVDIRTTLLKHPDDAGPDLTPAECAAILPGLQELADQQQGRSTDPLLQRHVDDVGRLVVVLRLCVEQGVELLFG